MGAALEQPAQCKDLSSKSATLVSWLEGHTDAWGHQRSEVDQV